MTSIKEWQNKMKQWDTALLKRQIEHLNNVHYEIIDAFDLRTILHIMTTELANRHRGSAMTTTNGGMQI